MEDVERNQVRLSIIETSEQFGSAAQAYKYFRAGTADICDCVLLGSQDAFRFRSRAVDLGTGVLIDGSMSPMTSRRPAQMIARGGIDHYQINLSLAGRLGITSGPRTAVFEPGDVYIVDLSQPNVFQHGIGSDGPDTHVLTLVLPRHLLAPLLVAPDAVQGSVISHQTAFGRLIADHMLALRHHAPYLDDGESRTAVASMACLAAGAFGQAADAAPAIEASTRAAQTDAIKRYIDRHPGSGRLEIADLCRLLGLSRTVLYRLFEREGGIAAYILRRRLRRSFSLLISKARPNWRIVDFAVDAGFSSAATFIRAFRRQFGVTPSDVRTQAEFARVRGRQAPSRSAALFDSMRWARDTL